MKRIISLLALAATALLVSCITLPEPSTTQEPRVVETPTVYEINQGEAPADIKLVTAAIIYRLRGVDGMVENVSFSPDGFFQLTEDGFYYEGFEMTGMVVTGYEETVLTPGTEASVTLEGVLQFKDEFLRKAGVYFAATYTVTRQGIVIQNAFSHAIPPDEPDVEAYMVPKSAVDKADPEVMRGYLPLYLFAVEHAVPMTCTPGQKQIGTQGDYFLMLFSKDRIFDDSLMEMRVSKYKSLNGGKLNDPIYIGENGWRIMISAGKFAPGSSTNRFYFGVLYDPAPTAESKPRIIALYSNEIQEVTANQRQEMRAPTQMASVSEEAPPVPQARTAGDGPIALGKVFLNPIMKKDAALIQQRLKDLGHYKGKVDGAFGKGSKQALDSYATSQGLDSSAWTLKLQKRLFTGSGK